MTVRRRLVLFGAVLPVAALLLVATIAGLLLAARLRREIDQHLTAQAAVESVGLFDGPDGRPHLHAHASPLAADLRDLIPDGAIYDDTGALVTVTRPEARVPARLQSTTAIGAMTLADADRGDGPVRELIAAIASPSGARFTLYLAVPRSRVGRTMAGYWTGAGLAVVGVGGLLLAVQLLAARRLSRRIAGLAAYLPRLREGQAEPPPPPDRSGDELAALRDGLYAAAVALEAQRAHEQTWLATAAHDLRTPLGVMRTTLDLALRRPRDAGELRAALVEVGAEVDRLRALADSLLAAGQRDRRRAPVELAAVARAALGAVTAAAAARGVALDASLAPVVVEGDAIALRRAIDNLLHNALGHAPTGTAISMALTGDHGRARLVIRDRGPGIPSERREEVFHPGARGADSRGSGLGLAIVRQIVTDHGGEVWVGDGGPGAELIVELPAADEA